MLPLLVPFILTAGLYFHLLLPSHIPTLTSTLVKCLPIFCLAAAAHIYGRSEPVRAPYARRIVLGLLASAVGDACLVWPGYFVLGMVAFALAHCSYITAFGVRPFNLAVLVPLVSICTALATQIMPYIKDEVIAKGAPVYSLFLIAMAWRAISRFTTSRCSWSTFFGAAGAVSFLISDSVLSLTELVGHDIPHSQVIIMTTYYGAQLGFTLSVMK